MDRPTTSPAVLFGLAFLCLLGGVPLTGVCVLQLGPEVMLRTSGTQVVATVTESRTMGGWRTGTSHELRYRFEYKGKTYTHSDATGRTNLWSSLPEKPWRTAVKKKTVPVVMLPASPTTSRLADASQPLGDTLAGLGLGLLFVFLGVAMGGLSIRDLRQRSVPNEAE